MSADQTVLDVDQVAALMRCEPATVRDHARAGDLPGLKWGRDWVFPVGALVRRLDELAITDAARRREPSAPLAVSVPLTAGRSARRAPPVLPQLDRVLGRDG